MKQFSTFILFFFFCLVNVNAQDIYFIGFSDKDGTPYSISEPSAFLTQRAIARRQKQSIPINADDLPVNPSYVNSIKSNGGQVLYALNWFNGVVAKVSNQSQVNAIQNLSFVTEVKKIYNQYAKTSPMPFEDLVKTIAPRVKMEEDFYNYGTAKQQIKMMNGHVLHNNGYRGKGMLIAVIDAGFRNADVLSGFFDMWYEDRVVFMRDVANPNSNLFNEHYHGTIVLSAMATHIPNQHVGTAPEAHYALIRSENAGYEQLIEEYNWVYAAQLADSIGADVINSSLGYYQFDDNTQNHTYTNMDGQTTPVAQGANFVGSKGVLVVNSVGNERYNSWQKLISPSDSPNVIAVGAVDANGNLAYFSSEGPSADGRVKPDVVAMGYDTAVQWDDGSMGTASGTSLSSPVLAGLAACLWQAKPSHSAQEIHQLIIESAHLFNNPNIEQGYGLPNFALIPTDVNHQSYVQQINIYPNPTSGQITLMLPSPLASTYTLSISTATGFEIIKLEIHPLGNEYSIDALEHFAPGLYIVQLKTGSNSYSGKILKVN